MSLSNQDWWNRFQVDIRVRQLNDILAICDRLHPSLIVFIHVFISLSFCFGNLMVWKNQLCTLIQQHSTSELSPRVNDRITACRAILFSDIVNYGFIFTKPDFWKNGKTNQDSFILFACWEFDWIVLGWVRETNLDSKGVWWNFSVGWEK